LPHGALEITDLSIAAALGSKIDAKERIVTSAGYSARWAARVLAAAPWDAASPPHGVASVGHGHSPGIEAGRPAQTWPGDW
jgi:hypothetical protein